MGFLSGVSSFIEKHSEAVHAVLDVAGFIPVVGAVADIANTALYIHEGDAVNAIMCGMAAIPGIGDLASLAKKSYNAFKTSKTGIKIMNALKKYKVLEKILKGRCFTVDTFVPTKHGYTTIKEIQKGDEILSRNERTGRTGFKEVEDVFIRAVHTIYHVWLDGKEEIKTTAYHPVYVQEQGWVTAINLREGDTLETMEGTACITKIVKERHEEPVTVYNLAVKDWVSYFVGQVRVYVHNGNGYNSGSNTINGYIKTIHEGKQGKHIIGHNNYIEGRSIFYGTVDDAQKLVNKFAGTGQWLGNGRERVDFGKIIGEYIDPGTKKGQKTTMGLIRYSKKGTHIVPSQPKN